MKRPTLKLAVLSAVAALSASDTSAAAALSHAISFSYSESGYIFQDYAQEEWFPPLFDPSLGELQSITLSHRLTWRFDASWVAGEITNGNPHTGEFRLQNLEAYQPNGYSFAFSPPGGDDITLPHTFDIVQGSGPGSYTTGLLINDTSVTVFDREYVDPYIGPGPSPRSVLVFFISYFGYGGECLSGDPRGCPKVETSAFFRHDAQITYNYKVAGSVPEAATWALMLGGFGFAGAAIRRRRTVAA